MGVKFTSLATTLLAADIDDNDTALSLTATTGAKFPTLSGSDWFPVVVADASGREIMRATARASDVITVTRGQEGTTARAFAAGAVVDLRPTAAALAAIQTELLAAIVAALAVPIETADLADEIITEDKLADDAVTTDKIADEAVTLGKLADLAAVKLIGSVAGGTPEAIGLGANLSMSAGTLSATSGALGAYSNLAIKVVNDTTATVTADSISVTDGTSVTEITGLSVTLDLGSTAGAVNRLDEGTIQAGKHYAVFAIAKPDGTKGSLASLSETTPVMPSGYTRKKRIGRLRTAGTAALFGTWQFGRRAHYKVGLAQTTARVFAVTSLVSAVGDMTSGAALVGVQVTGNGNPVPPTASVIFGAVVGKDGAPTNIVVAPNNSYGAIGSTTNPPPVVFNAASNGTSLSTPFSMLLESNSIYWACHAMTLAGIAIDGWEDNI